VSSFCRKTAATLWQAYFDDRSVENRTRLVEQYYPWLKGVVERKGLVPGVDKDELVSVGAIALTDCIERFDPTRGYAFTTFALPRVSGEMLDYLRDLDTLPRLSRQHRTRIEKEKSTLGSRLGRSPEPTEMAQALEISEEAYFEMDLNSTEPEFVSCETNPTNNEESTRSLAGLVESSEPPPDAAAEYLDLIKLACRGLNQRERLLVILYWVCDLTMEETGKHMGLTESRVSQLFQRIRHRVRDTLRRANYE